MSSTASALDDTLIALADPVRRGIVELLKVQPRRAGELATLLDSERAGDEQASQDSARQPAHRRGAPGRRRARARVSIAARTPRELKDWLSDVGAFWNDQLASFKAAADAAAKRVSPNDPPKARRPRKSRSGKRR